MEWQDEGIVLSASRMGEADAVLEVMTRAHGRARGFIKGGLGRRNRANLQVGNRLSVKWYARLEANLGRFTVELIHSPLGQMMGEGARISALSAIATVVASTLPERETHVSVFEGLEAVIELLEHSEGSAVDWGGALVRLEMVILAELGYGLDLTRCAVTGEADDLAFVSPKTGRAVSIEAGGPYKVKLLALPAFLTSGRLSDASADDVLNGLMLTGYFLERNVWTVRGGGQPAARERFMGSVQRLSA
ncbi:DNA repair protein RecO [Kordiimonas aestuarii]|uniref:DNA repair protein RecO n=1 Tax=Kordiimonas aestuarii TaxID=1005925 RepID=UPI0021D05A67|nr:DNA repair protein RecO [Kordiimonas aestuarii]